jgi:hypothetical protein
MLPAAPVGTATAAHFVPVQENASSSTVEHVQSGADLAQRQLLRLHTLDFCFTFTFFHNEQTAYLNMLAFTRSGDHTLAMRASKQVVLAGWKRKRLLNVRDQNLPASFFNAQSIFQEHADHAYIFAHWETAAEVHRRLLANCLQYEHVDILAYPVIAYRMLI